MRRSAALLISFAALLALVALVARSLLPSYPSTLDLERERLALEQARALAPLQTGVAAAWSLVPLLAVLVALGLAAGWAWLALARYRQERSPSGAGLLPVDVRQLSTAGPAALAAYHAARLADASRPGPLAHSLRLDYHNSSTAGPAALLGPAGPALAAPAVPSFGELLAAGRFGRGRPLILGYADGLPIEGSFKQLYSCAVGGLSGSGKTWTAVFLAAQAALYGSRIVLLDPHAADPESLAARLAPMASRYVCAPATEPGDMRRSIGLVVDELARRKAGARGEPWLFVVDEFSALQRGDLAAPLAALVEALGQEGRKLGLFALVAGQVWTASRSGGSELRDSLASAYVHRLRPAQARYLTGLAAADLPSDLLELPAGEAYLLDTAGDMRRVTIPQMTPADVEQVAGLLDGAAPPARQLVAHPADFEARPGPGPALARSTDDGAGSSGCLKPLDPEAAALLARFAAGATLHDLAAQLAGTANPSQRAYKEARVKVEALLRGVVAVG